MDFSDGGFDLFLQKGNPPKRGSAVHSVVLYRVPSAELCWRLLAGEESILT